MACPLFPMIPTTLLTLMIRPARRFIIPREAARMVLKAPRRLVSITASQSSSLMRIRRLSRVTPALFTRTSRLPISSSTRFTTAFTASESATSTPYPACPSPGSPSAALRARASSRAATATRAPAEASSLATARPIPREPPVTRATCP